MARKPRIHFPGACYHVILRGNGGQDIFFEKNDRFQFLALLQEGINRYKCRIHSYCLMNNHIHLVVQVRDIPLSRIMQNVSFRYTRYIHTKTKQMGHLFQGRYKAILIDADTYLLELVRYIHNNPVRAAIVQSPQEFIWSSHKNYLDMEGKKNNWLTTSFVLKMFADNLRDAVALYNDFIQKGLNEKHREEFYKGRGKSQILGDDDFIDKTSILISNKDSFSPTIQEIIQQVCEEFKISKKEFSSGSKNQCLAKARAVAALFVRESAGITLTELSREIQRDLSGLSQAASRLYKKSQRDSEIIELLKKIEKALRKPTSQA